MRTYPHPLPDWLISKSTIDFTQDFEPYPSRDSNGADADAHPTPTE